MKRRTVLATAIFALAGGCTNSSSDEPNTSPNNSQNDSSVTDDSLNNGNQTSTGQGTTKYLLIGWWLNKPPEGVEPYPTEEKPLRSNETLQEFFDAVVVQDTRTGTEDDPTEGQGNPYVKELSEDAMDSARDDLEAVEFSDNDRQPGRYVDHDGTYIWLTTEKQWEPA